MYFSTNKGAPMSKSNQYIYVVELQNAIGLFTGSNLAAARREAIEEEGRKNVKSVRPATQADLDWVAGMGGFVPEGRLARPEWTQDQINMANYTLNYLKGLDAYGLYNWLADNDWSKTFAPLAGNDRTEFEARAHVEGLFSHVAVTVTGIVNHPKALKLFDLVWEDQHSGGYRDVLLRLIDYSEVLK
jgi:hypothetical protein